MVHMDIFQKVRWTATFNRPFGKFFTLCHIHGYLNLSVILAQMSLNGVFEVSGNPGKTRAAKRTTMYILSFSGLCSFMCQGKQPWDLYIQY